MGTENLRSVMDRELENMGRGLAPKDCRSRVAYSDLRSGTLDPWGYFARSSSGNSYEFYLAGRSPPPSLSGPSECVECIALGPYLTLSNPARNKDGCLLRPMDCGADEDGMLSGERDLLR